MTADTIGGVWTYAMELSQALQEHGIEVALATMGGHLKREQRRQVRDLQNVEVFESSCKLEWMNEPWADVSAAGEWLLELDKRLRPDLIHLNNFAHGTLPWSAPKIVAGHSCVLSWWRAVKNEEAPESWSTYTAKVRAGLQAADCIVAPSRTMLQQLRRYYGPFHKSKVIYNARDPAFFQTRTKEEIIFSAGRLWDEAKNIQALATIAADIPWTIYVAGDDIHPSGLTPDFCKALCSLGKLPPEVLREWLARASIYTAPALYEPFGLTILEAALSGCALVLSDIPSLRENWNSAAEFVSPHDPEEFKSTLQRLIKNPSRIKELAAYAQCRAIQFNPKHMARDYLAVYADVLSNARASKSRRPFASPDVLSHVTV